MTHKGKQVTMADASSLPHEILEHYADGYEAQRLLSGARSQIEKAEVEESGFLHEKILPVEGSLWLSDYVVANFHDSVRRERFLALARQLEQEPSLLGVSAHILVVARKA
jgi:hypothetical protein